MRVLGIDPGPTQSGLAIFNGTAAEWSETFDNGTIRTLLRTDLSSTDLVAVEQIRSYGMAVGAEVFDTCVETGRFVECSGGRAILIPRMEVKMHLCHNPRARDTNIRQALLDRLGPQGTKAKPGPTYGVSGHCWAALAVAVTAWDRAMGARVAA